MAILTVYRDGQLEGSIPMTSLEILEVILKTFEDPLYDTALPTTIDYDPKGVAFESTALGHRYYSTIEWDPATDHSVREDTYSVLPQAYTAWLIKIRAAGIWSVHKPRAKQLTHEYLVAVADLDPASDLIRKSNLTASQLADIIRRVVDTVNPSPLYSAIYAVRSM